MSGRVRWHRGVPSRLKLALTGLAVLAAVAIVAWLAAAGQLHTIDGGVTVRLGGFDWNYYWGPLLAGAWIGGAVFLLIAADLWPAWLRPRHRLLQGAALTAALAGVAWLVFGALLHGAPPEPIEALVLVVLSGLAAYALLRPGPHGDALERLGRALPRLRWRRWRWWLAAAGCAAAAVGWWLIYGGHVLMVDAVSQISQARLMLLGHFTLDISQPLRDAINFPSAIDGVPSYSQFPPGYTVLLMPLIALGLPVNLIDVAAAGGIVLMTALLARRLAGDLTAIVAGLLMACSPMLMGVAGSAMNHATAALALLVVAWCWLPAGPVLSPRSLWMRAVLGGLLLGWVATVRPLTALAHGVAWCAVWMFIGLGEWRRARLGRPASTRRDRRLGGLARRIGLAGVALLPPLLILFFYDSQTTGHPLRMGYMVSNPELHRLGFSTGGPYPFTPRDSIENALADAMSFNHLMLGWVIGSWLPLALWWLRTRLARGEHILLTLIASQVFFYGLYRYHHLVQGPRFLFEAMPLIVVLGAMPLAAVLRRGDRLAGGLAVVVLWLSLGGTALAPPAFQPYFTQTRSAHQSLARFMDELLPIERPTVVVFDPYYLDTCGVYFPHDPGQPAIWFVAAADEARARALPELADCDWVVLR